MNGLPNDGVTLETDEEIVVVVDGDDNDKNNDNLITAPDSPLQLPHNRSSSGPTQPVSPKLAAKIQQQQHLTTQLEICKGFSL
eukprot:8482977-Ditylum_brightwellii.AAC.1